MSKKASKTAIGLFVTGAALLLAVGIAVFGSGDFFKKHHRYVLFFDGPVKGLSIGAPVIFQGVQIGSVKDISLLYHEESTSLLVPVIIEAELSMVAGIPRKGKELDYNALVKKGLRTRLEIDNFITGQLILALGFYPDRPAKFYGIMDDYRELPALPISPDIFAIIEELPIKKIMDDLSETAGGISQLVSAGGFYGVQGAIKEITEAARSIRLFVEYLEQHPESLLKGKSVHEGGN